MYRWTYLLFGFLFCLNLMGSQSKSQTDQLLWETMNRLGIQVDRIVYHHGGRTPHRIFTNQLDQLVKGIAANLHLSSVTKQIEADGVRYQAIGKKANVTTKFTVVNDQPTKTWSKPYISIQMIQHGKQQHQSIYQQLAKVLSAHQITPQIDCSMQGSKPYQNEPLTQLVAQAFQHLGANEVEAAHTKQVVSISAWSPRIAGGLITGGGQMNVQAATKVDEQANRLLFTIGSPIITIEY